MPPEINNDSAQKKFVEFFEIHESNDYFDPVLLTDSLGFSIKRKYNKSDRAFLPKTDPGNEYFALFHIYIEDNELKKDGNKNITIRVGAVLDKEKLYVPKRAHNRWPVDFMSEEIYQIDQESGDFFKKKKKIKGIDVLEEMYQIHVKPCKLLRGAPYRMRKNIIVMLSRFFSCLSQGFIVITLIFFGQKYVWNTQKRAIEDAYSALTKNGNDVKKIESPKENFFGYSSNRWPLFMYCLLHLITFLGSQYFGKKLPIEQMLSNPFFGVVYAFVSLSIYEKYLPKLFDYLIKKTTIWSDHLKYYPLKI